MVGDQRGAQLLPAVPLGSRHLGEVEVAVGDLAGHHVGVARALEVDERHAVDIAQRGQRQQRAQLGLRHHGERIR